MLKLRGRNIHTQSLYNMSKKKKEKLTRRKADRYIGKDYNKAFQLMMITTCHDQNQRKKVKKKNIVEKDY